MQFHSSGTQWSRAVGLVLRGVHIVAMAMVLGGIPAGGTYETLKPWILTTLVSGVLLAVTEVAAKKLSFSQGSGLALVAKLVLLGLGNVFPDRFAWYVAATVVASIGSHMPKGLRHFSMILMRDVTKPEPEPPAEDTAPGPASRRTPRTTHPGS